MGKGCIEAIYGLMGWNGLKESITNLKIVVSIPPLLDMLYMPYSKQCYNLSGSLTCRFECGSKTNMKICLHHRLPPPSLGTGKYHFTEEGREETSLHSEINTVDQSIVPSHFALY